MKKKIWLLSVFLVSFICGFVLRAGVIDAASNMVAAYFRGDITPGVSYTGRNYLINNGYGDYGLFANATPSHFYNNGVNLCNVVLVTTHGSDGYFTIDSSNTKISGNSIATYAPSTNSKLVYISACKTGNSSPTYGNVGSALCAKGVSSVVAFTGIITAPANSLAGIHSFNLMVIQSVKNGTVLYNAISQAQLYYAGTANTWGSEYAGFYGNGGLTL